MNKHIDSHICLLSLTLVQIWSICYNLHLTLSNIWIKQKFHDQKFSCILPTTHIIQSSYFLARIPSSKNANPLEKTRTKLEFYTQLNSLHCSFGLTSVKIFFPSMCLPNHIKVLNDVIVVTNKDDQKLCS